MTLKRGVLVGENNDLMAWIREIEKGVVSQRNISITIGNYGKDKGLSEPKAPHTWVLRGCAPTKWSMGNLDGNSNSPLIESLELVVSEVSVEK